MLRQISMAVCGQLRLPRYGGQSLGQTGVRGPLPPESFVFPAPTAAPVASKIETLPGPKDLKLPFIRKSFATDLDGAATERSRVFSPNSPIFSKA